MLSIRKNQQFQLLAVILTVLLTTSNVAYAATEGSSSGSAPVSNTAPVLSNLDIEDTGSTSKNGLQIDVNVEYRIDFDIADTNTLEDLTLVTITIWGPSSSKGGADADATHYTFTYTQTTDAWDETGPDGGGNSHLVGGSCVDPADQTAGSGSFTLGFKLAKTAEHTDTATWDVDITVTDDDSNSDSDATTITFGVNFYLEITVDDGSHGWSSLNPGATDQQITTPVDGDIDLTVTANAAYDIETKGSGALASGGDSIALNNVKFHENTLGSATIMTTGYQDIGGLTSEPAGASNAESFVLWLTVPNPQQDGSYTYTLYVQGTEA